MEITKKILNSGCNIQIIYEESNRLFEKIKYEVFGASIINIKKIMFNVSNYCRSTLFRLNNIENEQQILNHIINVTINMLKKIYIDSNIYYEETDIMNLYNNNELCKCIVVDWSD
jgi:hypothetical protein